ncbi:hypothetical protein QPX96_01625 [Limosilactobacillus fermentum]|nr:hypothetical protein [Limosilactobacillus fermentum]
MYNQITITPTKLIVSPAGLDRLWALKGAIRVPWRHVTGIFRDQGAFEERKGLRLPGTAIPGLYYAGSFFMTVNAASITFAVIVQSLL